MENNNHQITLEIYSSRKTGVRFVYATELHTALQLDPNSYLEDVADWLNDTYLFAGEVRVPREPEEYAKSQIMRPIATGQLVQDYFIKLPFAKFITLNSRSPVKRLYAQWLVSLEQQVEDADLLTPNQVVALIEISKVMGMVSCQTAAERQHYSSFMEKGGKDYHWWRFRADLLGYDVGDLRVAMLKMGRNTARRTRRQMLIHVDKYQMVRTAVIDLFAALDKSYRYAQNMGDLAYKLATELKVSIWDDRDIPIDFSQHLDQTLIQEVKALKKEGFMGLW